MGLKLELFIVALIIGTSLVTMSVDLHKHNNAKSITEVETYFTDTTFTEVTTRKRVGMSFAKEGWREEGNLHLRGFRYRNEEIERLLADKADLVGDDIHLRGNVKLYRYDGFRYFTQRGVYHKKSGVFEALEPFRAYMDGNMLEGETMRYNTRTKRLYAMMVHGEIELENDRKDAQ